MQDVVKAKELKTVKNKLWEDKYVQNLLKCQKKGATLKAELA